VGQSRYFVSGIELHEKNGRNCHWRKRMIQIRNSYGIVQRNVLANDIIIDDSVANACVYIPDNGSLSINIEYNAGTPLLLLHQKMRPNIQM